MKVGHKGLMSLKESYFLLIVKTKADEEVKFSFRLKRNDLINMIYQDCSISVEKFKDTSCFDNLKHLK